MPNALRTLRFLAPLAAFLPFAPAAAQDTGVVYAGGEAGEDSVGGYGGAVIALPGASLGNGFAFRIGGSAGTYKYDSGGVEIDGDYKGAEAALVYGTSGTWGWANFGAGPRVTDTDLSPADPGNELAGTRWDLALQTDGALGDRWRLGWFGSLGVFDHTWNTQLRFGPLLDAARQTRIGVEAAGQGDDSYTRGSLGLFASTLLADKLEGRLSGGFTDQQGRDAEPYAAISLSHTF